MQHKGNFYQKHIDAEKKYLGSVWTTRSGSKIIVDAYKDSEHVLVRFLDTNNSYEVSTREIMSGYVRDQRAKLLRKTVHNTGIVGIGKYSISKHHDAYRVWADMLRRCYASYAGKKFPAYTECKVATEWHIFQNFAEWFYANLPSCENPTLDKDILFKRNKIYSPNTCCIVPKSLNVAFVRNEAYRGSLPIGVSRTHKNKTKIYRAKIKRYGETIELGNFSTAQDAFCAYKKAKETYIKELAEKYKNQLLPTVYQAITKYRIEITD